MINIFIDTNIFISAFFFDGNERKILSNHPTNTRYYTSQQVINEIEFVLMNKFQVEKKIVFDFISKLYVKFTLSKPNYNLKLIVRDDKDTDILKSALSAKCKYLITGDKNLLTLKQVENTKIIKSKQLIKEFNLI